MKAFIRPDYKQSAGPDASSGTHGPTGCLSVLWQSAPGRAWGSQSWLAAAFPAAFGGWEDSRRARKGRLKAGCGHDWPPHKPSLVSVARLKKTAPLRSRLGNAAMIPRDLLLSRAQRAPRQGAVLPLRVGVSHQRLFSATSSGPGKHPYPRGTSRQAQRAPA